MSRVATPRMLVAAPSPTPMSQCQLATHTHTYPLACLTSLRPTLANLNKMQVNVQSLLPWTQVRRLSGLDVRVLRRYEALDDTRPSRTPIRQARWSHGHLLALAVEQGLREAPGEGGELGHALRGTLVADPQLHPRQQRTQHYTATHGTHHYGDFPLRQARCRCGVDIADVVLFLRWCRAAEGYCAPCSQADTSTRQRIPKTCMQSDKMRREPDCSDMHQSAFMLLSALALASLCTPETHPRTWKISNKASNAQYT